MTLFLNELLKFGSNCYIIFRLFLFNLIKNKDKTTNILIIRNQKFKMIRYGDIVKILFSEQHLIPFKKSFEYASLEMFYDNLNSGDVVLDVGANVGIYSLLASKKVGPQGKIYAFEPTDDTFNILLRNMALNECGNVFPRKLALSDQREEVTMRTPSRYKENYGDALKQMRIVTSEDHSSDIIITETLDEFVRIEDIRIVNFIKVDIEGAELLFYRGAEKVLSKHKPRILFEASEIHCKAFNYGVIDVLVYLNNLGYKIQQVNQEQWYAE